MANAQDTHRGVFLAVRVAGVLLGLFLLSSAMEDVAGVTPQSGTMPPLAARLKSNLPAIIGGLILCIPFRYLRTATRFAVVAIPLLAVSMWFSAISAIDVLGFMRGAKSYHIVPVAVAFAFLLWGNLWVAYLTFRDRAA